MKRVFIITVAWLASLAVSGQAVLRLTLGSYLITRDAIQIVLNNVSVRNEGTIQQTSNNGFFIMKGSANDSIAGNGLTIFDLLHLAKDPGKMLVLKGNIRVDSCICIFQRLAQPGTLLYGSGNGRCIGK